MEAERSGLHPIGDVWATHRRAALTGFALIAAGALAFNTFFVHAQPFGRCE